MPAMTQAQRFLQQHIAPQQGANGDEKSPSRPPLRPRLPVNQASESFLLSGSERQQFYRRGLRGFDSHIESLLRISYAE